MNREDHLCWFHGKISRERAEQILHEEGQGDGVFLVRESNTSSGDFVLSVLHQGQVWHYQIRRHGEDAFFSIDDQTKIHGLDSLIEYYQQSSNGLVTQLSAIVKRDPPPNDSRSHGKTNLLHRATKENNQTVVSELLKCGYRNFDAKNQDGQTAVHLACIYSTEEILKLLIKAGANVNSRDTIGNTPLHYACRSKSASFIRTLVNAKANIQNRNIDTGFVPLHDAAKYGNLEAVQELLKCDAPHMPRTTSGEFPIDFAREGGHNQVVNYLQQYKPPPANTYSYQWYHGTLDRTEAIKLINEFEINLRKRLIADENLNNANNEGLSCVVESNTDKNTEQNSEQQIDTSGIFLVRYSNRSGYVLTLLCEGQAKNFIIQKAMSFLYIDEGPYMISLEHLIQHYKIFSDGLPVKLRYAVPPKPKPPLPLFSTMPKSVSRKYDQKNKDSRTSCSPNNNNNSTNGLQNSPSRTTKRNFSHPGDDAMNQVGLFETEEKEEYLDKKKREMHIFRSLKPRSPRKNIIIDGMKSLRKAKLRNSPIIKNDNNKEKVSEEGDSEKPDNSIHLAESLIKNLTFSSDFLNRNVDLGFYNIPQNNCAVVDIDIGEGGNNFTALENNDKKCKINENKSTAIDDNNLMEEIKKQDTESKLNDNNYFTKSDKEIDLERNLTEATYFVDAPAPTLSTRIQPSPHTIENFQSTPATLSVTSAGYVPTVDVRIFLENNLDENASKVIAESSAELREFSKHPERLDSVISRISTDSEFMGIFNQNSPSCNSSTENSRAKLNYFIPNECLSLNDIIGEGEFGSVYKGTLTCINNENDTNMHYEVAIKTLRDEHCRSNKQEFLREASVMIQLKHHCIVKLIGISKGRTLMMVQELVPLGSMLNYILNNPDKINPNYELKIWASQIACGMNYLESQHFVHRDLAARNILLASRHQVKISDFGLSRALSSGNECYQASQGGKWPIKWYAPESFNHGYFSHASDVWSFGITLWEMYSLGQPPYGDMRGVDAIKLIEKGHRLPKPDLCPDNVYKIMENCWNYKPKDRPTFQYLTDFFTKDPEYQNLSELVKSEHIS